MRVADAHDAVDAVDREGALAHVELALDLAELGVLLGPQLRALKLNMNAKLTGDLQELSKTTHMENLGLGGTQVKGDIKIFESMPKLSSLVLASTLVSGDISVFTCTPQLEALNLSSTEVSGDIKTFANTPLMSKLNVHETQVTVPVSCPKDEDGDLFYDSPEAFATLLVWIRGGLPRPRSLEKGRFGMCFQTWGERESRKSMARARARPAATSPPKFGKR